MSKDDFCSAVMTETCKQACHRYKDHSPADNMWYQQRTVETPRLLSCKDKQACFSLYRRYRSRKRVEHHLSGPREGGLECTVTNGLNEEAMCGGALFDCFVKFL